METTKFTICDKKRGFFYGFTLLEMLVMTAVIAVLLAVLLPSLRKVRSAIRRTVCQSNLRQIAIAWIAYLDDNNGAFYQAGNANLKYGGWKGNGMLGEPLRPLNRYFSLPMVVEKEDDARIFCCPSDHGGAPGPWLYEKVYRVYGTSYNTNFFLIGPGECGIFSSETATLDQKINKRMKNVSIDEVANPARLLLVGDYGWLNQWRPTLILSEEEKELVEWHGRADCYNMAFLDGHVKFLNIQKGFYVTSEYCVLPFPELFSLANNLQRRCLYSKLKD